MKKLSFELLSILLIANSLFCFLQSKVFAGHPRCPQVTKMIATLNPVKTIHSSNFENFSVANYLVFVSMLSLKNNSLTQASLPTDYFRSSTFSGDWSNASSWESSSDNLSWFPATLIPTNLANNISISVGNLIGVSTNVSLDQLIIDGTLEVQTSGLLSIADGPGDDIKINPGGILRVTSTSGYASTINQSANASVNVLTGGKIAIGNGAGLVGAGYENFATSIVNVWGDGSIFEHNSVTTFLASGTYFPNPASGASVPVFRVSLVSGSPGNTGDFVINGLLEVNSPFSFSGSGKKTFRDGIIGTSILTLSSALGTTTISSPAAVLGGSGLTLVLNKTLNITTGLTVPSGANVLLSKFSSSNVAKNGGTLIINGTIDITDRTITNTSGSVIVNGILKTSAVGGFYSPGNIASGIITLNPGSTIEYNGTANQSVTGSGVLGQSYYNITFSGGSTKTPINAINVHTLGTVKITSPGTVVDATANNIGLTGTNSTNFLMDNGLFIIGTGGTQPRMEGSYTVTGGTIRYVTGTSAKTINNKIYQNIEIVGNNVSNSNGNIGLNDMGTFTVKTGGIFTINDNTITGPTGTQTATVESGGIFRVGNNEGLHGFTATFTNNSSFHSNIETLNLLAGSTVEYMKTTSQNITNTVPYYHLIINGAGSKVASTGITTVLGNFSKTSAAVFRQSSGTFIFNGAAAQIFKSLPPLSVFNNLTNNNITGFTINDSIAVAAELQLASATKLNIADTSVVVLKSTAAQTANVAVIPSNVTINYNSTGAFIVERYINVGTASPFHTKAWQFLAVPTSGQTLNADFQEGNIALGNLRPGYGTLLTRPTAGSTGYDASSISTSIKTYNSLSDAWDIGPASTSVLTANPKGWLVFVRGDRSSVTGTGSSTTMRTKGQLLAGNFTTTAAPDKFESVGNPYASAIDLRKLNRINLTYEIYVWDPTLGGSYGVGGYRVLSYDGTDFRVAGGGGGAAYPSSINNMIQSGQAFFIKSNGVGPSSLQFTEASKSAGSALVNRMEGGHPGPALLDVALYRSGDQASKQLIDGAMAMFNRQFSRNVDWEDGIKLTNYGENIGFRRNTSLLSVERMPLPSSGDTLHLDILAPRAASYSWQFQPTKLDKPGRTAYLLDQKDNTKTLLSLNRTTEVNFTVTNDGASMARDRFKIIFVETIAAPLPVTFRTLTATRNVDQSISLKWTIENELNVKTYTIERSADGINFTKLASITATSNRVYRYNDAIPPAAENYYRIKSIDMDGAVRYSPVVKALPERTESIRVYPNPVVGKCLQVCFSNLKGEYKVQLRSAIGQVIYNGTVKLSGSACVTSIELSKLTAAGKYQLIVVGVDGKMKNVHVIIE